MLDACDSQFDRDVLQKIMALRQGIRPAPRRPLRINIIVEGPHARLAVECERRPLARPDVWHKYRARQQVLERAN